MFPFHPQITKVDLDFMLDDSYDWWDNLPLKGDF